MKNFKYFLLGVGSIIIVLPIINKFLELIDVWIEALKIKPADKILEHQKKVVVLSEFINPQEYYDDDYEEHYNEEE